jgi:hypothetical protein
MLIARAAEGRRSSASRFGKSENQREACLKAATRGGASEGNGAWFGDRELESVPPRFPLLVNKGRLRSKSNGRANKGMQRTRN